MPILQEKKFVLCTVFIGFEKRGGGLYTVQFLLALKKRGGGLYIVQHIFFIFFGFQNGPEEEGKYT